MGRFREALVIHREMITVAALLLILGSLDGFYYSNIISHIVEQMMNQLKDLVENMGKTPTVWTFFWTIFLNNLMAAFFMILFGLFFGIFPAYGLFVNGAVLGFVLRQKQMQGGDPLMLFVQGILPHGILELPAIIFAAAIGMKLGVLVFHSIFRIWRSSQRAALRHEWRIELRVLPSSVLLIALFLIIAAFIESTVTPLLMLGV